MIVQDKLLEGHDHPHPSLRRTRSSGITGQRTSPSPGQAITAPGCLPLGIRVRLVRK